MTDSPRTLALDIVSDFVCPWCFIGLKRLDIALAQFRQHHPDCTVVTRWRPFFLNPDTPPEGEPYLPFLIGKFGSREAVEALFQRVREHAAAYDLHYDFAAISRRANTLQAHRLVDWAQRQGDARALVERIFVGQFQRGEFIGDPQTLLDMAAACGYDRAAAARHLAGDDDVAALRESERAARAGGIRAVPSFVIDQRIVVAGAEEPSLLTAALTRALTGHG